MNQFRHCSRKLKEEKPFWISRRKMYSSGKMYHVGRVSTSYKKVVQVSVQNLT